MYFVRCDAFHASWMLCGAPLWVPDDVTDYLLMPAERCECIKAVLHQCATCPEDQLWWKHWS